MFHRNGSRLRNQALRKVENKEITLFGLSRKRLHDGLKHEPVVVRQPDVELLELDLRRPRPLLLLLSEVDQTLARAGGSIPDLEVDGDRVDDGQRRVFLGAEDAGKDLGVVEVAREGSVWHVRPVSDHRRRPQDDSRRIGLRWIGDNDHLKID